MEKIIILSNLGGKIPKCVDIASEVDEISKNAKSISTMFFWDVIPSAIHAYNGYCDMLNKIYSTNHNFIKCDTNGRQEKEIGK